MRLLLLVLFAVCTATLPAADSIEAREKRLEDIIWAASRARLAAKAKADAAYIKTVSASYRSADRVEVYLLELSIGHAPGYAPNPGDPVFPIRPYDEKTKVLKVASVPVKDIPAWCAAVTKMVTSEKEGFSALCHYPIHGIRLYQGDTLLFETSLCWACHNYYFSFGDKSDWKEMTDDCADLKKLLDEFMPIPQAEMDRLRH